MSSLIARVVARYKVSVDIRRLNLAWHTFKGWNLSGPASTLEVLIKAFDSKPLSQKLRKVLDIDSRLKKLDQTYTSRIKSLENDPSDLPNLQKELKRELKLIGILLERSDFNEDDVYDDVLASPIVHILGDFDRSKLIDQIGSLSDSSPTDEELSWLQSLDFSRQQRALDQVLKHIPDFSPSNQDSGSFEFFKNWVNNLPKDYDEWEDSVPYDFEEINVNVEETSIGGSVKKYFGSYQSLFDYIKGDLETLLDDLDI
jgi:hypothetical protein